MQNAPGCSQHPGAWLYSCTEESTMKYREQTKKGFRIADEQYPFLQGVDIDG